MDIVVLVFQVVASRASTKVPLSVDIDSVVIRDDCPYSEIKLPAIVKEWFFNIFLDNPVLSVLVSLKYEIRNVSHVPEYLDASTLVKRGRFDKPHILLTMFEGDSFVFRASS